MQYTTEQKQRALDNLCGPVVLDNRIDRNGNPGRYTVDVRRDRPICKVSDRYELVQNADLVKPIVDRYGVSSLVRASGYRSGITHFEFETGREFDLGAGDVFKERIVLQNSYNKTRSFRLMMGAFRMVCSNGLYTGQADTVVRQIHTGKIDAPGIISKGLDVMAGHEYALWHRMNDRQVTDGEGMAAISDFMAMEVNKDYEAEKLPRWQWPDTCAQNMNQRVQNRSGRLWSGGDDERHPRNVWGLFNAINSGIAGTFYRRSDSVNGLITANVRAEKYLADTFCLN